MHKESQLSVLLYVDRLDDFTSIVLIIYTFISVWLVGGLSGFHFYLMSTNQTTYENFGCHYDMWANPYDRGVVMNIMEVFFTSIPPSKNKFRAKSTTRTRTTITISSLGFSKPKHGQSDGRH